jgi:hypothetical protein
MSKGTEELLDLLKSEVGVDELPDDLTSQVEELWPDQPDTDDLFTQEDVDEIVQQRLARERKAHEQEIDELKEQMEDMVDPSEHNELKEKFDKINDKTQERVAETTKEYELKLAAAKEGVRKDAIDDFAKLVDKDQLEYDDGEVKGLDDLIESVKEEKQFLFEPEQDSSSGGSDFGGEGDETDFFTKEQVEEMSQEEVDENLDKIEESMSKW